MLKHFFVKTWIHHLLAFQCRWWLSLVSHLIIHLIINYHHCMSFNIRLLVLHKNLWDFHACSLDLLSKNVFHRLLRWHRQWLNEWRSFIDIYMLHSKRNNTPPNLDCLGLIELKFNPSCSKYKCSKFGKVVFKVVSALRLLVFQYGMTPTYRDIADPYLRFMASSKLEIRLARVWHDEVHHPRWVFFEC